MGWVDQFYKWLESFLGANAVVKLFFILADILVLVFCLAIILFFANNNALAYRAAAKEVLRAIKKGANEAEINEKMKSMPYIARSLWHRFRKERKGKPSDYLTITQCLAIPNKSSWTYCMAAIVALIGIMFGAIVYAFSQSVSGIRHACTLVFLGCFLAAALIVIEKISYNSTLYTHERLVWALNKKSKEFAIPSGVTVPEDKRIIEEPSFISQADYTVTPIITEGPKIPKPLLSAAKPMDAETQNLLLKIDAALRAKAPVNTLRQLAAALQRLKSKPENSSPENQQKINKAMSLLLKAISESYK
ncbi:MAG TPA: hypothetical protein VIL23_03010 [Clostridia bacterium]